jgi:hypothetical protein
MGRRKATFRSRDITAAVQAARKAGLDVQSVSVEQDGKIVLSVGKAEPPAERDVSWDAFRKQNFPGT